MAIPVGDGVQELRILRRTAKRPRDAAHAAGALRADDRQAETVEAERRMQKIQKKPFCIFAFCI